MTVPYFAPLVRVAVPVAMSVLLVGCGGSASAGPNVDQVGYTLQNQVYKMLYATTADSAITDALFDNYVPCADGKVKITYAVSGRTTSYAATGSSIATRTETRTTATPKQIIDDLIRFLPVVGTFKVTEHSPDGATVKLLNANTHTRLTLHSPARDRLTISGETDCMKPGRLGRG